MLIRFDRLKQQYTIQMKMFEPVLFMINPFYRLIHKYPMQINRFKPVIFMVTGLTC